MSASGNPEGQSHLEPRAGDSAEDPIGRRRLRVAVASADGKFVHQHFGRATHFQVFDLNGSHLSFVETRLATPACGGPDGHNQVQVEALVELVSDCDVVLVAQIGPGATAQLAHRGVRVFEIQDFIPDALQALGRAWSRSHPKRMPASRQRKDS
jgi:predicted Fe-Mo cluster-binding NifX family protein